MRRLAPCGLGGTLLAVAGLCAPAVGLTWGEAGHRITGRIAQRLLTEGARAEVLGLIGEVDLGGLAPRADRERGLLARTLPGSPRWHYEDRLVCHPDLPYADYCPDGNCASAAIGRLVVVLADHGRRREDRAQALMLLVHIIGDVHQPLHAADNNDRGGNQSHVRLPGEQRLRSLHAVWDVELVRRALSGHTIPEYAAQLEAQYARQIRDWQQGRVADWIGESYAIARDTAYGALPGFACDLPLAGTPLLPASYLTDADRQVGPLLVRAGARIAAVLNQALDTAHAVPGRDHSSQSSDRSR